LLSHHWVHHLRIVHVHLLGLIHSILRLKRHVLPRHEWSPHHWIHEVRIRLWKHWTHIRHHGVHIHVLWSLLLLHLLSHIELHIRNSGQLYLNSSYLIRNSLLIDWSLWSLKLCLIHLRILHLRVLVESLNEWLRRICLRHLLGYLCNRRYRRI